MVAENGNINILSRSLRSCRLVVRKLDLVLWTEFANFAANRSFFGELPERSIGHAWKACVLLRVPRVRIPHSPLLN